MKNDVELHCSSNGLEWHPDIFNRGVSVHYFNLLIFNIYLFICSSRKLNFLFFFLILD